MNKSLHKYYFMSSCGEDNKKLLLIIISTAEKTTITPTLGNNTNLLNFCSVLNDVDCESWSRP